LSEERIRSFIAVEVSDEEVMGRILSFQKSILDTNANLRLVEAENIHITLRFLGEIPASMVEKVSGGLKGIQFSPFEVDFRGVGVFPSLRRINVIWIGIHSGVVELIDVFNQIESRLKKLGFHPDTRGFRPHVTVARVRSSRNKDKLSEAILGMRNKEFGTMLVDSVKLKKSVLTPRGPIYSTLCEVKGVEE
jgi:2'-5' RNA ligase